MKSQTIIFVDIRIVLPFSIFNNGMSTTRASRRHTIQTVYTTFAPGVHEQQRQ
jgi:hypothetical protein